MIILIYQNHCVIIFSGYTVYGQKIKAFNLNIEHMFQDHTGVDLIRV